ncbi:putative transposon, En/Spm-like protein [Tanacetum coccineum]
MGTTKTKDNIKARKDVKKYCNRAELHIRQVRTKDMKPKVSYTLTKPQVSKNCEWLTHLKFPDGYASNLGGCVSLEDQTFYSFKSHECHVFMQRLLPIALRGMIPNSIWDQSIVETICKLEKNFPPGFFDSMEHLVIHLTHEAILGGPVQYRWMYLYERRLGSMKRKIRNQAKVEGSMVESYRMKNFIPSAPNILSLQ